MTTAAGRPRSEQSQKNILAATFKLLREVGYDKLSIEAIAAAAGVGKSTIYRWYKTKEDLVVDALARSAPSKEIPNKGSLAADMEALVKASMDSDPMVLDRQSCALTISALAGSSRLAEIYWRQHIQPKRSTLQVIFVRAKERGELASDADPDVFFDMLHGTLLFTLLMKPEESNLPQAAGEIVQQLLKGFGP